MLRVGGARCGRGASAPKDLRVYAADIDPRAVACARRNLAADRVFHGDLATPCPNGLQGQIDMLLVNAPYVPSEAVALMPREARLHEPRQALDGGPDGLDLHRRLAARRRMAPPRRRTDHGNQPGPGVGDCSDPRGRSGFSVRIVGTRSWTRRSPSRARRERRSTARIVASPSGSVLLVLGGLPDDQPGPGADVDPVVGVELVLGADGDRVVGQRPAGGTDEGAVGRVEVFDEPAAAVGRQLRLASADPGVGAAVDSGLMLRLADLRPTSTDVLRSGTTSGRPGEGSGSGLSCASYQAGSIQTSATQSNSASGVTLRRVAGDRAQR